MLSHVVFRVQADDVLGHRKRLDLEKPPNITRGEFLIRIAVHREGRRDVHETDLTYAFGMIETKAMCSAGAAVVTRHKKLLMAEVPHRLHLILSHRSKRVVDVALSTVGLAGIAIASQVRY